MLSSHPSPDALDRYRRGLLPPEELLAVDDHLAACAPCRDAALRAAPAGAADGLDTLLGGQVDEHPEFEELSAYVDGVQDGIAREVTEMHLADCPSCRDEVADLRALAGRLAEVAAREQRQPAQGSIDRARSEAAATTTPAAAASSRVVTPGSGRGRLWLGLALPAAAVIVWLLIPRSAVSPVIAPSPWPSDRPNARLDPGATPGTQPGTKPGTGSGEVAAVTLRDGGRVVTLDEAGKVTGLPESLPEAEQTMVMAALSTGRLALPELIRDIAPQREDLRGSGVKMPFQLREPLGTAVESDRPRFRWDPLQAARAYIVSIYDDNFASVARSPELASPEWISDRPLARGKTYTWTVSVLTSDESTTPAGAAPSARFVVLTEQQADALARAKKANPDGHLMMALAYARAGVRDGAERELRALQRDNPDAAIVRALLASLR